MSKIAQIDFENIAPPQAIDAKFKIDGSLDIGTIITNLLPYFFTIGGVSLLLYLLIGGFKLMTAGGDPKKMQEGQHIITNAFIGFLIIFVSFWLVQLLGKLFGLQPIIGIF